MSKRDRLRGALSTVEGRRRGAVILGVLAAVAGALAVWAQATDGFRVYIIGVPISVRGETRPALVALLLALASLHLSNAWRSPAARTVLAVLPRTAPWIAGFAAICVLVVGVRNASTIAGASDPSGYVSQSTLWLRADVKVPRPDVGTLPWPEPEWTFVPLGYRLDAAANTIIPTYAPGLSLLMALATLIAGACGPYLVSPICAALLVWATYSIGFRLSGRAVGTIAAVAVAVSPTVLIMTVLPMSDVPNAAFWTLSMLFASRGKGARDALLAGGALGIATVIRPNLAPLAAIPALLTLHAGGGGRRGLIRVALFAVGCAPFVAVLGAISNHLYGSPLRSGYGSIGEYYSLSNMAPNLSVYPRWFLETQGVAAFAFVLAPVVAFAYRREQRTERLLYLLFIAAVYGCYLFFLSFQEWWYLRFLLPAFPFAFILGADAVSTLALRFGRLARLPALLMFGAVTVLIGVKESSARTVVEQGAERRYADAAEYLQRSIPHGAVVMTMQHSGSVAYYSDKLPLRYDRLAPEWIDRAIDYFHARGRRVYVLLDDWEIPIFAERFRGQRASALVRAQPLAATPDGRVRLFATDASELVGSSVPMPKTRGCVPPAASNFYTR